MKSRFIHCLVSSIVLISFGCMPGREPAVRIDTGKTGAPIEKYIYGQFIEHLGRCIYGGIWAEMVEDRKFYYPIQEEFDPFETATDEFWGTGPYQYLDASPWEIIGSGKVEMDKDNPYSGEYSARIMLPGDGTEAGIRQYGLGTIAGKIYNGRIILSGDPRATPVILRLKNPEGENVETVVEEISDGFRTYEFAFEPPFTSDSLILEIVGTGSGKFNIGTLSLMPADHISGWRKEVVALMKELDSPVYRWPGGNFVSGYNWRDGIGERDRRPPRKNPAWKGVESNDVGIHEYMELMEILGAEPFIAVNTGLGTLEEVVEEVEYVNGPADSKWGKVRAENGHPDPYHVKWWAVGNEMYGSWQLGHMPLTDYVKKHNSMAEAIWEVDPGARLIGVGAVGEWSRTMLGESADKMNLISEHIYCREMDSVRAHIGQIAASVKRVADAHREYRSEIPGLSERNIRIAMDEWNYWYGDYIYGELGVRYHHKDALGIARGLHEYFRNSDLFFMANYAQTVNVIGCIKTTPTTAGFATTAMPLILYRKHFGTIPVAVENSIPGLDITAALSADKTSLTLAVVNDGDRPESFYADFGETGISKEARMWLIRNDDPEAYNVPGEEPEVKIVASETRLRNNRVEIPAYAIMMLEFDVNSAD